MAVSLAQMSKKMFKADDLYVLPSKSGKLTKEILQKWLKDVYFPSVPDVSVLILDAWSAQNEENISYSKPGKCSENLRDLLPWYSLWTYSVSEFGNNSFVFSMIWLCCTI